MKSEMKKKLVCVLGSALTAMTTGSTMMLTAFADDENDAKLEDVASPIVDLLSQVFNVLMLLVGAVGAIYCISLGVKFARAEEPQEREKAKSHLKNAIIGFVLIFVLVVALRIAIPNLSAWMNAASSSSSSSSAA